MVNRINSLKEGKINEIQLNEGQGILYNAEDNTLYLVNFFDKEHTTIKMAKVIACDMAYHLACSWLGKDMSVA